ncbi:MAG: hypothetical protein H6510_16755 [Acidobacteria bacterium]|nr:hypothetical protein [Acidobacteriota bacterium]
MVNNLGSMTNAVQVDGLSGAISLTSALTASLNLNAGSGQTAIHVQNCGTGSVINFMGPVDILSAGDRGLHLEALSGTVNFTDLSIAGVANTSLEVTGSDAEFTLFLDTMIGINSPLGRSVDITNNTGGFIRLDQGPIFDGDQGIRIASNVWDNISYLDLPITITTAANTGITLTNNTGGLGFYNLLAVTTTDQPAAVLNSNQSLTISFASLTVLQGLGSGATALSMANNTNLNCTFSSITGVNNAGKGVDLNTNGGGIYIHNLNLTTMGGIGLDATSSGQLVLNTLGGSVTLNTTNALGLDIDNTDFSYSIINNIQVTGTGGGINLVNNGGDLTIEDAAINVSGATALVATGCSLDIDPTNTNSISLTATGQRAIQLNGVTTSGFNLASTNSTGATNGVVVSACLGPFNFGDTTITSSANGVDLSNSPTSVFVFDDLDVTSSAGVALAASNVSLVSVDTDDNDSPVLSATTRPVLDIDNCRIQMNLATLSSSSSTTHGVDLTNLAANSILTMSGSTTITSPSTYGINIDNVESGANLVFGNVSVTNRGNHGIFIQNFNGTLAGFGDADIPNGLNVGGDGVHVQTSGGGATSSGAIQFASLDISDTNVTVDRLDAGNDGTPDNETYDGNGVKLMDHTGSFGVTGTGPQGNGGTIQNIEGDGFSLIRSGGLDLNDLVINNIGTSNQAPATVDNAGIFAYGLIGSNSLQDCTISRFQDGTVGGGNARGISIYNNNISFTDLHITDTTFFNDNLLLGDDAILIQTFGTVNGSLTVDSAFPLGNPSNTSEFYQLSGTGVQVNKNGSGDFYVSIADTVFRDSISVGGFGGVDLASIGAGVMSNMVDSCLFLELYSGGVNNGGVITLFAGGTADYDATVNNCTFGSASQRTSDGRGAIRAATDSDPGALVTDFDITITNNTIDDTAREAISLLPRGGAVPLASGQTVDFTVMNNDIGQTTAVANSGGSGREGIEFVSSDSAKLINFIFANNSVRNFVDSSSDETLDIKVNDNTSLNAIITGNTFNQTGAALTAESIDISINSTGSLCLDMNSANTSPNTCPNGIAITETAGTFSIEDIGGAAIPAATVDTFIEARNTGSATVTGTFDSCNSH